MGKVKQDRDSGGVIARPMHKVINELIQLQELCVAKAHHEASSGQRVSKLDDSIASLTSDLPEPISTSFQKLQKKGLLIIVPVSNNVCTSCGMGLAKSLVQSVRTAETLHFCPNCARFLYFPEVDLRGKGKRVPRGAAPKVGVARFSAPELMITELAGTTREEVLAEMTEKLEAEGFVDDAALVLDEALNREAIASTSVDHGLAFPHVRGVEGGGLAMVLGISKKGIKFDPQSKNKTHYFFFMVIPTAASPFYLKLLAGLTQSFREQTNLDKLMDAKTPAALWKTLVRVTRTTVK